MGERIYPVISSRLQLKLLWAKKSDDFEKTACPRTSVSGRGDEWMKEAEKTSGLVSAWDRYKPHPTHLVRNNMNIDIYPT